MPADPLLRVRDLSKTYFRRRWLAAPQPAMAQLGANLIYIVPQSRDRYAFVATHFENVVPLSPIDRTARGQAIERYDVYRVAGLRGGPLGRTP